MAFYDEKLSRIKYDKYYHTILYVTNIVWYLQKYNVKN